MSKTAGTLGAASHPGRRAALHALLAAPLLTTPLRAAANTAPDARVQFVGDQAETPWMAFEMPDLRRIIMAGTINDQPARIMLDSGAGTFTLTRSYATALGLTPSGNVYGAGVGGVSAGQQAGSVRVVFANLAFVTQGAAIFDLDAAQAGPGAPFDAIIGRDLFDAVLVDIDFRARRIAFRASNGTRSLPGGHELRLARGDFGLRTMPVTVAGQTAVTALIDLGADRPFHLSPRYAGLPALLKGRRVTTTATGTVNGLEIGRLVSLDKMSAAGAVFTNVPTEIPANWNYAAEAVIGFPVFRRFRMLADFAFDRICLQPALTDEPFRKDRCGIGARRAANRLEIVHIAAGSPAQHAGLHAGDVITAVNGHALTPAYFAEHPRDGSKPAGTRFAFTLADGSTKELVLEDYF